MSSWYSAPTPRLQVVWGLPRPSSPILSRFLARPAYPDRGMAILEEIRSDLTSAMRAGEKQKVGALRLVLSELQKAAKEGSEDELAVLRRERKRRLEAAQAYRDAGQEDRAGGEEAEGELIAGYLPPELSEEDA